ncbi:MAG: hypothetical protein FWG39_01095 [Alphaproteobacteria bacterium]|nr:hypothetical protein [Alphaproteobacteria bacterium]
MKKIPSVWTGFFVVGARTHPVIARKKNHDWQQSCFSAEAIQLICRAGYAGALYLLDCRVRISFSPTGGSYANPSSQ